jgi:hemerythrin superfamily protein
MTSTDVVALLEHQHVRIRRLFATVRSSSGADRRTAFDDLRRLLAVHETAEEMVVHPSARRHGANDVVDARLAEEHDAKQVLKELIEMDVEDADFDDRLATFERMVLDHADGEEREEFPHLRTHATATELSLMAKAVLAAEALAPTRPHPGVESMTLNLALGPVASLVDRTRDAVQAVLDRRA